MCRSVPQTPACRTAIKTSPGPGAGFGTDFTVKPGARFSLTIACMKTGEWGVGSGCGEANSRALDAHRANLELSHLCVGIQHRIGEQVGGRFAEVERHEYLAAGDALRNSGGADHRVTAGREAHQLAFAHADLPRIFGMNLD